MSNNKAILIFHLKNVFRSVGGKKICLSVCFIFFKGKDFSISVFDGKQIAKRLKLMRYIIFGPKQFSNTKSKTYNVLVIPGSCKYFSA